MRSKIPKIISGILAIILIVWLGYALLSPARFWIAFEFVSAVLVAVGCVGELYLFHLPSGRIKREKEKHHYLESRFILAVAVGVTMELFALAHAISEATRLEQDVASANERTSANELHFADLTHSNLVLQTEIGKTKLELAYTQEKLENIKNAIPPRQIPEKQRELFIATLLGLVETNSGPKIDIKVFAQEGDDFEANSFADSIRKMLNDAGYGTNREKVIKIPPFTVSLRANLKNARMPPIFAIFATDNNGNLIPLSMPSMGGNIMTFFPTKKTVESELGNPKVPTASYFSNNPNDILGGVCNILSYIGFRSAPLALPGLLKPGEVAFYIPPQVQ